MEGNSTHSDDIVFPGVSSGVLCVTASSVCDASYSAYRCTIGFQIREGSSCWAAANLDKNQYLQFSSPIIHRWHKIKTIGRDQCDQWVTSYIISYTTNGEKWIDYNNCEVLSANRDRNTEVTNELIPFLARAVRIRPFTYNGHISAKVECYISEVDAEIIKSLDINPNVLIPAIELGFNVTVSSVYDASYDQSRIRINYSGNREGGRCWISATADLNQWVCVSSVVKQKWRRVSIQGRGDNNQYVSTFALMYTENGKNWHLYNGGRPIQGNVDQSSVVNIDIEPIYAKSIKLLPLTWSGHISLRLEIYFEDINS